MPSPASFSAAATAWSTVIPHATIATSSPSRTMREPPIPTSSPGGVRTSVLPRSVRMNEIPSRSAIAATSLAVWLASEGCKTVEPWTARNAARSSSAICDGPSSPIDTPACEPDSLMLARDRGHADEVVRARQERRERRREREPAADLHADSGGDHLLLGDEHLEVAVLVRLAEHLRVSRVRDLAVERDHVAAHAAERGERLPVRLARGLLLADFPARQLAAAGAELVRIAALGRRDPHRDVALAAELRDRGLGIVERLAVLAGLVLDRRYALALLGPGDDHGRRPGRRDRLVERGGDRVDVVAVDGDRVPAERLGAADVAVEVPADHRLARLAEPVDVDDRGQVVQLVERRVLERLPDRALGHLRVAAQAPDPVRQPVEPLARQRHADCDRQPLAERAR